MKDRRFRKTDAGYQTSKNRVSFGVSLTEERAEYIRSLARQNGLSLAEQLGRLIDAERARLTTKEGVTA